MTHQQIQLSEGTVRPWAIVRLLPKAQRYTVARFYNRQDAHDHLRFLKRWIPAAEFEIVFDAPVGNN
jgi:putative acetyltransferase